MPASLIHVRGGNNTVFSKSIRAVSSVKLVHGVDLRKMIRPDLDAAAAIGLVRRHEVADIDAGFAGEFEAEVDPVLEFLIAARFHHRHEQVFAQVTRIGGHLRRIAPRIVADEHDRAAFGMRAGEVAQRQRVGGHVQADRFHRADAAQRAHLRAVEHGGAQRFVVGDAGADPLVLKQRRDFLHRIKKTGNG